ncbi:RNA polymerase sigma factor [Paenarthrobacter histidinolovorans]|uniref:RNA polymerase sigma factor (Sigma-70 family) n=1 Tax=Paenarthrobacter histidinolovorans TaxID=43664 RepID=A0ABW8N0P9_9MICC
MTTETEKRLEASAAPEIDVRVIGSDSVMLERFYRAHLAEVERFVARRVSDPHTAADMTADVFVAAMTSGWRFDPAKGNAQSWLYGIAHRVVADAERKAARRWRAQTRERSQRVLEDDAISRLESQLDAEAMIRQCRALLEVLPKTERVLLELTALEGLSVADAALAVGISPGAARVRLHRTRKKFHFILDKNPVLSHAGDTTSTPERKNNV